MAVSSRADIQEPINAHNAGQREQRRGEQRDTLPANATTGSVKIHQGETTEIVLTARGQVGKTIEFMIRTPPAHGTLDGPPRQLTRTTASVTYTHRAEDGPGTDTFTYAVQGTGSAVSAAVPVTIEILDTAPDLAATPPELDFGTVKAGETTRASLTLENRGGGTALGQVEPPPPWTVDGDAQYHLARGETQTFQLVFKPAYGRSYVESLHFRGSDGPGIRLLGSGIGPRDPSEDLVQNAAPGNSMAEVIAQENARAIAAENAALHPPPAAAGNPAPSPASAAMPAPSVGKEVAVANAAASPPPAAAPGDATAAEDGNGLNLPPAGADSVVLNEAGVTHAAVRSVESSTFDLTWTPPRPTPKSYRIELRYLTLDEEDKLRVDWRPYASVNFHAGPSQVTAHVTGLPAGTRQTVRVVAVNDLGQLAAPSPTLVITTGPGPTWWHVTPLKVLVLGLVACLGLMIYRRWEEQQSVRALDESRAARNAELMQHRS